MSARLWRNCSIERDEGIGSYGKVFMLGVLYDDRVRAHGSEEPRHGLYLPA